jgi:hypothetical protein
LLLVTHDVAVLRVAGQPVLPVIGGDDRIGPARAGLRRQRFLAGIKPIPAHPSFGLTIEARVHRNRPTHPCQIRPPQRAKVLGDQVQYVLVIGGGPQPGADRHPARAGDRFHPTPGPQRHRRHAPSPLSVSTGPRTVTVSQISDPDTPTPSRPLPSQLLTAHHPTPR